MLLLIDILLIYLGALISSCVGILTTNFIYPKGFWILVPLRVGGWKSYIDGKIYPIKWPWETVKF